jgi:Sec-independent protein translocase protein TatA
MNVIAPVGHNNPPDPIVTTVEPYLDYLTEAETLLDGGSVETEGQMKHYDTIIKGVKEARKAIDTARDESTRPLHEAWKGEVARWKPTQDDLDRIIKGLIAAVDSFKRKLAAEKAEAERKAREEAYAAKRAAEDAHRAAMQAETDLEAQRVAAEAFERAEDAWRHVGEVAKDTVKGLRTVTIAVVDDYAACVNWIRMNDRQALTDFMDAYVQKAIRGGNHNIAGVTVRTEKQAY